MTLNGVMTVILRYFSEFGYLPGALRKSSRSLSHLATDEFLLIYVKDLPGWIKTNIARMWANAQRDGRLAEHRWRLLFNAAKLIWLTSTT